MRRYLFLLFSIPALTTAFGQEKEIGIKLRASADRFLNSGSSEGFSSALFYSAGISGNLSLGKRMFLSSGINYGKTGAKIIMRPFEPTDPNGKWIYQLKQVTIPLSLGFTLDRKNNLAISAGLFGEYLFDGTKKFKAKGSNDWTQKTDISDLYKKFNYGLHLNAGYRIPLNNKTKLQLGLEEELGLKNIYAQNTGSKLFTQSFGLLASLMVSL